MHFWSDASAGALKRLWFGSLILLAGSAAFAQEPTTSAPASQPARLTEYTTYAELTAALHELTAANQGVAQLASLTKTVGGRDVWVLTLAADTEARPVSQRQGLLLVGGVDAELPLASELPLRVAQRLLESAAADADCAEARLLRTRVVYVVPRLNPDGLERAFQPVRHDRPVNGRPIDDDRDALVNEDGGDDLNGDGLITVMRVRDPDGPWIVDKDEPRLLRKADVEKGEVGQYRVLIEGIDDDADGALNEDGFGGVDLDRNWPHFFTPGETACGLYPMSEPETRALADFVVTRRNISAAIVFGRNDNVVTPPTGKERGVDGETYRDLHPDDTDLYRRLGERYRTLTHVSGSAGCDARGALYAWLYSQEAILTVATGGWWPSAEDSAAPAPTSQPTSRPVTSQPAAVERRDEVAADGAGAANGNGAEDNAGVPEVPAHEFPPQRSRGNRRGGEAKAATPTDWLTEKFVADEANRAWLAWCDRHPTADGFVSWTALPHATLGMVEVGGFAPHVRGLPPAEQLPALTDEQTTFVVELSNWLAEPRLIVSEVRHVGNDVWRVALRLENGGKLPTHLGIALQTEQPGFVIRPDVDASQLLGGSRLARVKNVPAGGVSEEQVWLLRGREGDVVNFRAYNRRYGEMTLSVTLNAGPQPEKN